MIFDELNKQLKEAMFAKNEARKNYIRSIKSKITEYEILHGLNRDKIPSDECVLFVINSHKKSLEKAIKQLKSGGDISIKLVEEYKDEIKYCNQFLPNEENKLKDLDKIVDDAIKNVGYNVGTVIGYIMKNNKLDGSLVKTAVVKKLYGKI